MDAEKYALQGTDELSGSESYHGCDYSFCYKNLQKNAAERIAAYNKKITK